MHNFLTKLLKKLQFFLIFSSKSYRPAYLHALVDIAVASNVTIVIAAQLIAIIWLLLWLQLLLLKLNLLLVILLLINTRHSKSVSKIESL